MFFLMLLFLKHRYIRTAYWTENKRTPSFLQVEQLQGLEVRFNIHVCP